MILKSRAFTLIELVIAIVIIGVAVTGILLVMTETTAHSADPMIEHQEIAIADAYLQEILSKSYADPNGSEAGESRGSCKNTYDDVLDYNNLSDNPVLDQSGCQVQGLAAYSATVIVSNTAVLGGTITNAEQVTVTVYYNGGNPLTLTGYRTNY